MCVVYTFLESAQAPGEEMHTCSVCVYVTGSGVGAQVHTSNGDSGRSGAEAGSGAVVGVGDGERGREG